MGDLIHPSAPAPPPEPEPIKVNSRSVAVNGLFVIALTLAVYFAKPVLLPVAFALLFSLVLFPIHARLVRWLRMPQQLSATLILVAFMGAIIWGAVNLRQPAIDWFDKLPGSMEQIEAKVQSLRAPISQMSEVAAKIDELANMPQSASPTPAPAPAGKIPGGKVETRRPSQTAEPVTTVKTTVPPPDGKPLKVEVSSGGISQLLWTNISQFGVHLIMTMVLMFFMLSYGEVVYKRLASRSRALSITSEVTSNVSSYLFTVTVINAALGVCIGIAMYLLGMPNPVLWGVLGALLNYVPYLGSMVGEIIVFFVALLTFDSFGRILAVPGVYLILTTLEGSFITPMILGNQFTLNPIFIFIWLLFWSWYWGIPGGIIAMPLLMAFKIVCDHFAATEWISDMISLDHPRRRWRIQT